MTRLLRRASAVWGLLFVAVSAVVAADRPEVFGVRLGLGDAYKVGCWAPLRVLVEGGDEPIGVTVLAVTPDSDAVGVATTAPAGRPLSTEPNTISEERLYVRIGQQDAPIEVRLIAGGRTIDRRVFSVGSDPERLGTGEVLPLANAATDRVTLQLGAELGASPTEAEVTDSRLTTAAAVVNDVDDLPRDAVGYDGFNAVVLAVGARSNGVAGGWLDALTPNDDRVRALIEWVETGGHLVLSCGAGGAALLGPGGALADLAPGRYETTESLNVASAIERYADAPSDTGALSLPGGVLTVMTLADAKGTVEAYAGRSSDESPLVIRTPRGFGEVTFVAFDLDAPALAGWEGRPTLVRKLLGWPTVAPSRDDDYYGLDYYYQQDIVNNLLSRLDTAFTGVRTAPFLTVVGLVVLYLLLIGPGDYFFVKKVLGRVEATWVTFPILVAATSAAAYFGAYWLKGGDLRVNQVEFVDIDSATGATRGLLVTHLFSPRASRYDLSLAPKTLAGEPLSPTASGTAWLGKPGLGLGGMRSSSNAGATGVRPEYQLDATPLIGAAASPTVAGMPVQVWSTKSLVSRYAGKTGRSVESQLAPNRDGLVEGTLTNDTGVRLGDCRLLYGSWAWKLGDLGDGASVTVDPDVSPIRITSLLSKPRSSPSPYGQENRWTSIEELAQAMSVGALATEAAGPASRYLHGLDLTHHLADGQALLLAQVEGSCSELVRPDGPLVENEESDEAGPSRRSWTFARFILDVDDE